jgi:hypothetical protein
MGKLTLMAGPSWWRTMSVHWNVTLAPALTGAMSAGAFGSIPPNMSACTVNAKKRDSLDVQVIPGSRTLFAAFQTKLSLSLKDHSMRFAPTISSNRASRAGKLQSY